jgi:hypothetical protein
MTASRGSPRFAVLVGLWLALTAACSSQPSSGVRGDLRYVGGPPPGNSKNLEPGRVVAYELEGGEADSVEFAEGQGFELQLAPGMYLLIASSGDASCPHKTITVTADAYETLHVKCSVM